MDSPSDRVASGPGRPGQPGALIKHHAQVMSALVQLKVSEHDVLAVRAVLRAYVPGVEAHLGYVGDGRDEAVERVRHQEAQIRAYWAARLLHVLQTPLQQPVANVRVQRSLGPS